MHGIIIVLYDSELISSRFSPCFTSQSGMQFRFPQNLKNIDCCAKISHKQVPFADEDAFLMLHVMEPLKALLNWVSSKDYLDVICKTQTQMWYAGRNS